MKSIRPGIINTILICLLGLCQLAYGQSGATATKNYILSYSPRDPVDSIDQISDISRRGASIRYFDGLGRPIQTIAVMQSPDKKNIVQNVTYDQVGRLEKTFLPYELSSSPQNLAYQGPWQQQQNNFYSNLYGSGHGQYAFAQTTYENSPLNRVLAELGPGQSWHLAEKKTEIEYGTNQANHVQKFTLNYSSGALAPAGFYQPGTLYKNITTDADGRAVTQWTDFRGLTIRSDQGNDTATVSTYYYYDDFARLRWVIPPKALENLPSTLTPGNGVGKTLCYYYRYDERGRLIEKHIPGAEPVFLVYDNRDRLVMSQDGNQRSDNKKQWAIHLYDDLNRLVYSALIVHQYPQSYLQYYFKVNQGGYIYDVVLETDKFLENFWDTDESVWPSQNFISAPDLIGYPDSSTARTKGLLVASRERIVNPGGTLGQWLYSRYYYDERGRLIQTYRQTDDRGSYMHSFFNPNWAGEMLATKETYYFKPPTGNFIVHTLHNEFAYDHAGRMISTVVSLKSGSQTLAAYSSNNRYDALGRLVSDSINGNKLSTHFDYNIRNWLTNINSQGAGNNPLMDFQLSYENHPTKPEYGGNITSANWKYGNLSAHNYDFTYDAHNRLKTAAYTPNNRFSTTYQYDSNGNLERLTRHGKLTQGNYGLLDSLEYRYAFQSNRLTWVLNKSGNSGEGAFENKGLNPFDPRQRTIYEYDANGNMRRDNRTLRDIYYNFLNLPRRVYSDNGKMINYTYTASGAKVRQQLETDGRGGLSTRRDYAGAFVFVNNAPGWVSTPHGRFVYVNDGWQNEFHLRDHLGNTRVVLMEEDTGTLATLQQNHYYPFGMLIPSLSTTNTIGALKDNRYLYNGKEFNDDFDLDWYDYGARFYDAQIARWHSVDPLAEKYYQWSPYNYVVNNPINAFDPDGREPISLTLLAVRATIGAAIDFSAQMAINQSIHGQSFSTAWRNVDWVSVGTSAVIGAATIPGLGTTARTATIATAAVTNGAVDVRIEGGTTTIAREKEIGAGIIDAVGSAANFKASDAVVGGSKRMVSSEIQSGTFSTLNKAEKNLVRQTNRVVNSEGYNAGVSAATSVATEAAKVGAKEVIGPPLAMPSAENNFAPAATTNVARPVRLSLDELNQR